MKEFTRRDFLKRSGVTFVTAFGLSACGQDIFKDNLTYRSEVEKRYNIRLQTLNDVHPIIAEFDPDRMDTVSRSIPWNQENIRVLDTSLSIVPPHFYRSDSQDEKVSFVLSDRSSCICHKPNTKIEPNVILLDSNVFLDRSQRQALIETTHELAHNITPYNSQNTWSPWFDEIYEILGGKEKYMEIGLENLIEVRAREKNPDMFDSIDKGVDPMTFEGSDLVRWEFFQRLRYATRFANEREMPAVLAETYIQGDDYFLTMLSDYFSSDQTRDLRIFTKKTIFQE